ncbi:hypothetical protein HK096_005788 [Nowakowskiella sp. JEL0078]|nr:hypothetical protein HK096_005788 [Nowakowskiella sp. JEL0078]
MSVNAPLIQIADALELEFPDYQVEFVTTSYPTNKLKKGKLSDWTSGSALLNINDKKGKTWTLEFDQMELKKKLSKIDALLAKEKEKFSRMEDFKKKLDKLTEWKIAFFRYGGMSIVAAQPIVNVDAALKQLGWDLMEPVSYLLGSLNLIFAGGYYIIRRKEMTFEDVEFGSKELLTRRLYNKRGFDLAAFLTLEQELSLRIKFRDILTGLTISSPLKLEATGSINSNK